MSRYKATIRNAGKPVSRQGHAERGIRADIRGWATGVKVIGHTSVDDDTVDVFDIYSTGGSGSSGGGYIGLVTLDDRGHIVFHSAESDQLRWDDDE
jgi:hypothetical protein